MKLAWFSPLPPIQSGISEYSELILNQLKNDYQIDLWVDGYLPRLEFYKYFRIIDYTLNPEVIPILKTYDAIIYNMGNSQYHTSLFEVLRNYPGIVILHDYVLHHFMADYWLNKKKDPESYFKEILEEHGPTVEKTARLSLQSLGKELWTTEDVIKYPLNGSVLEKAKAVVVHSEFVKKLVENHDHGKVVKFDAPAYPIPPSALTKTRKDLDLPENKLILTSFGFKIPNKRIDTILEVISNNKYLYDNIFYLTIGQSDTFYDLDKYLEASNVTSKTKNLGYLPIEKAYAYIHCSDICINLRNPTMGETSASLLRMMSLGKPVIVSKCGWYAELPDEAVVKIDPLEENQQLTYWLTQLVKDISLREKIGRKAAQYILRNHDVNIFAEKLSQLIKDMQDLSPDKTYIQLLETITNTLYDLDPKSILFHELAEQISWAKPSDLKSPH